MPSLPPILYEDEVLVAFDKPSGMPMAPEPQAPERVSLMGLVHTRLAPTIFNVHRLDADTSGVLLCAKTKPALTTVARQFEQRQVHKRYLAIITGDPREDDLTVDQPITQDHARPGAMRVFRSRTQTCVTRLRVLTRWRRYALVEALPLTGKTHQIRVHLAHIGCPILADPLYGNGVQLLLSSLKRGYKQKADAERPLIRRLALHAQRLTVSHPVTGTGLTIESPLPNEFDVAIKYLNRYDGGGFTHPAGEAASARESGGG